MNTLALYGRIWLAQIRYATVREMMFKSNFILWLIVDLSWFGLSLCFIQFLYLQVDMIAGWSKWGMILLVSTNNLVQQLFQTLLMVNLMNLPELIRSGKLDFFLAQPGSPQFLISTRRFDPSSVISSCFAILVCVVACAHLDFDLSVPGLVLFPALVLCGVMIHYALLLTLMSLAFWMTRAQGFINAYFNVFQIARLPREAFKGLARFIFTWAVPLLLVANVPARTLLHGISWSDLGQLGLMTSALAAMASLVFRQGLKRYGSASS